MTHQPFSYNYMFVREQEMVLKILLVLNRHLHLILYYSVNTHDIQHSKFQYFHLNVQHNTVNFYFFTNV